MKCKECGVILEEVEFGYDCYGCGLRWTLGKDGELLREIYPWDSPQVKVKWLAKKIRSKLKPRKK